ncbi:MAG TPA: plastocyanin/azurin family copper-binding protein [Dokdonella sp.]|nr:plastocyanin/azurin family copper-binding protein [Dokdonella sp.]
MHSHFRKALPAALSLACAMPAVAATHTVTVGGNGLRFSPRELTIAVGDSVTFTNAGGFHNVHAEDGSFRCANGCDGVGSGDGTPSNSSWSATVTFNAAGTFPYTCDVHADSGMTGTITVEGGGGGGGNVPITSGFTGTWVDSGATGSMGFGVEVLPGNNLLAEGYTFAPDGGQAWIGGVGPISGNSAVVTVTTIDGPGGRFPPNFDQSQVQNTPWGTLTFTFSDCGHGQVAWNSTVPGYGSGTMPLLRVTQPAGITCP